MRKRFAVKKYAQVKKANLLLLLLILAALAAIAGCSSKPAAPAAGTTGATELPATSEGITATVFKSMNCGCCSIYSQYLKKEGFEVQAVNTENLDEIKVQQGVPASLTSCHTTIVGDYFVEGHIPSEAVMKLLTEKPDIRGIAMPGMPSGSPGMPGAKLEDFIIQAVHHDGSVTEFMRI